jgi:hypothetical protein
LFTKAALGESGIETHHILQLVEQLPIHEKLLGAYDPLNPFSARWGRKGTLVTIYNDALVSLVYAARFWDCLPIYLVLSKNSNYSFEIQFPYRGLGSYFFDFFYLAQHFLEEMIRLATHFDEKSDNCNGSTYTC